MSEIHAVESGVTLVKQDKPMTGHVWFFTPDGENAVYWSRGSGQMFFVLRPFSAQGTITAIVNPDYSHASTEARAEELALAFFGASSAA